MQFLAMLLDMHTQFIPGPSMVQEGAWKAENVKGPSLKTDDTVNGFLLQALSGSYYLFG